MEKNPSPENVPMIRDMSSVFISVRKPKLKFNDLWAAAVVGPVKKEKKNIYFPKMKMNSKFGKKMFPSLRSCRCLLF